MGRRRRVTVGLPVFSPNDVLNFEVTSARRALNVHHYWILTALYLRSSSQQLLTTEQHWVQCGGAPVSCVLRLRTYAYSMSISNKSAPRATPRSERVAAA